MKPLPMSEFRASPGERLIDVQRDGASFLLTKGGKPAARLLPVDDVVVIERDGRVRGEAPLTLRRHMGGGY